MTKKISWPTSLESDTLMVIDLSGPVKSSIELAGSRKRIKGENVLGQRKLVAN